MAFEQGQRLELGKKSCKRSSTHNPGKRQPLAAETSSLSICLALLILPKIDKETNEVPPSVSCPTVWAFMKSSVKSVKGRELPHVWMRFLKILSWGQTMGESGEKKLQAKLTGSLSARADGCFLLLTRLDREPLAVALVPRSLPQSCCQVKALRQGHRSIAENSLQRMWVTPK